MILQGAVLCQPVEDFLESPFSGENLRFRQTARETETTVGDFATINALLGKLGHVPKAYQENRSHSFKLDGTQLEIEADCRAEVVRVAALLGYGGRT